MANHCLIFFLINEGCLDIFVKLNGNGERSGIWISIDLTIPGDNGFGIVGLMKEYSI